MKQTFKISMNSNGRYVIKKKIPFLPIYCAFETGYELGGSSWTIDYSTLDEAKMRMEEILDGINAEKKRMKLAKEKKRKFVDMIFTA